MRDAVGVGHARRKRHNSLTPWHIQGPAGSTGRGFGQDQLRLPRTDQIDIDFRKQFGVEQRAVFGSAAVVDGVARAEIVEPVRHAGVLPSRQQQRVHQSVTADRLPFKPIKFRVDEADIERSVVNDQRRIANEFQKLIHDMRE
jgi:hypothetical protein